VKEQEGAPATRGPAPMDNVERNPMNAHRQHEHARRISGFIWQTLNQRGIQCGRPDVDKALQELSGTQLERIEGAAGVLAKGGDSHDAFELLAAFRTVARASARAALRDEKVVWRADVLLEVATGATAVRFNPALNTLLRAQAEPADREAAVKALGELCGTLTDADLRPPSAAQVRHDEPGPDMHAPPAALEPAPASTRRSPAEKTLPRKAKVYGNTAALTVEQALLRDGTATTVMIEAANKLPNSDAYDWRNKVAFQITLRELPEFFALLMGWIDATKFRFHGQENNKNLSAEHQPHGLYLAVSQGTRKIGVPIEDADRYALAMLVLAAMTLNEPQLTATAVLEIARATMQAPVHLMVRA